MKRQLTIALTLMALAVSGWVACETMGQPPGRRGPERGSERNTEPGLKAGIAWYGVLEDGLAVAKEADRPIFLLSAAPQCAGVPGMW